MTGYTVHTGSTEKFSRGWDQIFKSRAKKATSGAGKSKAKRKSAGKASAKSRKSSKKSR
jgi:hypothetical protein